MYRPASLFEAPVAPDGSERFDVLFETGAVVIERIVSSGSQPAQRFRQAHDEWVLLVRGRAEMRLAGEPCTMLPGDFMHIPADTDHEVVSTDADTLWLAVHVHDRGSA